MKNFKSLALFLSPLALLSSTVLAAKAPIDFFPTPEWKKYMAQNEYKSVPKYFGYKTIEDALGQTKKRQTFDGGSTIPVVVQCGLTQGCANYNIQIGKENTDLNNILSLEFNGHASFLEWGKADVVDSVLFLDWDQNTDPQRPASYINRSVAFPHENNLTTLKGTPKNYGDVIAVVYFKTDALKNLRKFPLKWGDIARDQFYTFSNHSPIDTPYLVEGSVWKLVDSVVLGPKATWTFTSATTKGANKSDVNNFSLTAGVKSAFGNDTSSPMKVTSEASYTWKDGWKKTWADSDSTKTSLECPKGSTSELAQICALYSWNVALSLVVPGLSVDANYPGVFDEFNKDPQGHSIMLSLGSAGAKDLNFIYKDSRFNINLLMPYAGIKESSSSASDSNVGVGIIQIPN